MKQTMDDQLHFEAWQDTPFSVPPKKLKEAHEKGDPDHLLDVPGVHLKSKEYLEKNNGSFPMYYGRLTKYDADADEVLVHSKVGSVGHRCIWTGTVAEYKAMWMVD